jgi:1,4-dihydroxy-2-naphthoate octaprenyltransferase
MSNRSNSAKSASDRYLGLKMMLVGLIGLLFVGKIALHLTGWILTLFLLACVLFFLVYAGGRTLLGRG